MAGLFAFAAFANASQGISSGRTDLLLGSAGRTENRLTVGATGLVPGDTVQRRTKLTNAGNQNVSSVKLTTVDTTTDPDSVLTTDVVDGLQMKIEKCAGALGWTESVSPPYTYTCDAVTALDNMGMRTTVLATRAVVGTDLTLSSMSSLTAGNTDDIVVTVTLPSTAGNDFQNKSATIEYTFSGS